MPRVYEVRPSRTHGLGVFATHDIKRGDLIGLYEGPPTREDGTYVLWVIDEEDGSEIGIDGMNDLKFLNHSPIPNCAFDGQELFSLRDIAAGEELTFHYGEDWAELDSAAE